MIRRSYESLIFEFRGYKVMVDSDLAALYETETKNLKQQVKRNINRFPQDLMFELTKEETNQLITNCDRLSSIKHSFDSCFNYTKFVVIRNLVGSRDIVLYAKQ